MWHEGEDDLCVFQRKTCLPRSEISHAIHYKTNKARNAQPSNNQHHSEREKRMNTHTNKEKKIN